MPVDGYSSSAASAASDASECHTTLSRKKQARRYSDVECHSRWDFKKSCTASDSSSDVFPQVKNPWITKELSSRNSPVVCHKEICNWREIMTQFQNEYIHMGFIKAFPDFGIFLKSKHFAGEMLEQLQSIEKCIIDQKTNIDKASVSQLYSFMCIAFTREKKFGLANSYRDKANYYRNKAKEVQEGTMLGKESAWLHIANALYMKSFPESLAHTKQETNQDIFTEYHLQQARIHFQYACNMGEPFQTEKALCLWWQVYLKMTEGYYQEKLLIHALAGSESTPVWSINVSHLQPEQIEKCQMILLTCQEEVKRVDEQEGFMELVCRFITETLSKISESTNKGMVQRNKCKSLKEQFEEFENKLARYYNKQFEEFENKLASMETPAFIQSYYMGEAKLKIFIDIDKGKEKDAISFLQKHFPSLLHANLIFLAEQEEFDYLMDPDEVYAALDGENKISFASCSLESGSQVMSMDQLTYLKIFADTNMQRLEDIQRKYISKPSGSTGGFMKDQEGNTYMITASHPLNTKQKDGKNIPKPCCEKYINLPILSEVSENNKGKIIRISDTSYSGFGAMKLNDNTFKAIDIAAVKIKHNINDKYVHKNIFTNLENKPVEMEVYSSSDGDLLWKEVQKTGNITGTTYGRIIFANRKTKINDKDCSGVFIVKGITKKSNLFAQRGDSGALVISHLRHERKAMAYGLCYRLHSNYYDAEFDQHLGPVTWCVRLNHSLEFLKLYFGLNLSFYDPPIRNNSYQFETELSSNQSLFSSRSREETYSSGISLESRTKLHQSKSFCDSGVGTFSASTHSSLRKRSLIVDTESHMNRTNTYNSDFNSDFDNESTHRPNDEHEALKDEESEFIQRNRQRQKKTRCIIL